MLKLCRSVGVAIGLTEGGLALAGLVGLASAQSPLPPMRLVLIEISPRAAIQAGAEWYWSPTADATKLQGPFQSGDVRAVDSDKVRIAPRQLTGPCVAPAAVDIEIKAGQTGYVVLAYSGAGCV